jgi:hypothetical protein
MIFKKPMIKKEKKKRKGDQKIFFLEIFQSKLIVALGLFLKSFKR